MTGALDPATWLPAALAVRLGSVGLALALARRPGASRWAALGGSCLASLLTGALAWSVLETGRSASGRLLSHTASGFVLGYSIDGLSAWFLLVLALLGVPIAVYGLGYRGHGVLARRSLFVAVGFSVLLGTVEMVFAADGVVGFLFAWELMTLCNRSPGGNRARGERDAPRRVPVPRDVARCHRVPVRRFPDPRRSGRFLQRSRTC